jgi:leucine efflux protein
MAFFPLFIDPARHRGIVTFGAMAITIAAITVVYCLTLCAFADRIAGKVKSHPRLSRWLSRLAGVFLIGFGVRLLRH